ncbi:MAG: hypothetical protein ACI88G_001020 [Woeseiaceae bacterium]|jgi:hypothetical protein
MHRNRFYLFMLGSFLALALTGFSRSFYLHPYFDFPALPAHLYVHGTVLTAWFVLAFIQPYLVASSRVQLHRRLGVFGAVLAVGVATTGLWIVALRDAPTISEQPMRGAGNILSVFMFASCVSLGIFFRHKPATHKRLMLMASMPILAPALDRIARIPALNELAVKNLYWLPVEPPEAAFALLCFLLLLTSMIVRDLVTERRVHPGTLWGLAALFPFAIAATFGFVASGAWVAFVHLVG